MPSDRTAVIVLLSAVSAVIDLDGCTDRDCTDPVCWIGCLSGDERALAVQILDELAVDRAQ